MQTKRRPSPIVKGIPLISYFSGLRKNDKAVKQEVLLPVDSRRKSRAYVYFPYGKDPKTLPGIFLPHGMNILGIDDIRMENLARNLAMAGYSVITPEIEEVTALQIDENVISIIGLQFLEYYKNRDWHLEDRVSFLSVSFSGSMGLISFSREELREMPRSFMAIGSCCNFIDTYEYSMKNFTIDNYAGLLLILNYLKFLDLKLHSEIYRSVYEYAIDNALHRTGASAMGPREHEKLRPASRDFLQRFMEEASFRKIVSGAIRENLPQSTVRNLSPYYHLGGFRAPLSLLHGSTDPVIDPGESVKIYRSLKNRKHPVHLEISDLITHGDQIPLHSQVRGVPGVTRAFGYYFSWI